MKTILRRSALISLGVFAFAAVAFTPLTGCASGGYGYDGEYYYDSPGYVIYDGWGPTYYVGPPRGGRDNHDHGDHHDGHGSDGHGSDGHARQSAYRPAPSSRAVPSIPTQSRPPARAHGKP